MMIVSVQYLLTECSPAMAGQVSLEMEPQLAKTAARDDVDYVKLEEKVNHSCI